MDIAAYQNMRISTRGKRPLRNLTPGDKVRAIQRIHNGETKASVSRDIGVPESTLRGWCKNEQKLRFMCRQLGAALNEQGLPLTNLENPPEKRAKLVDPYDSYGHSYNFNRLGVISTGANRSSSSNSRIDNKGGSFISNNVISDFMKKSGIGYDAAKSAPADSVFLQGFNALSAASNFSQLPLIPNAHLLSFLNPNLAVPQNAVAANKLDGNLPKMPLRTSIVAPEIKDRTKKPTAQLSAKNVANESLSVPTVSYKSDGSLHSIDKNDTNNNAVRPTLALSPSVNTEMSEFPTLFPLGLPLPTLPALNIDPETRKNAILQWTKVFNASLNFLALAAAAAAVQPPMSEPEFSSSANSESSEVTYRPDEFEMGTTRPLVSMEHSEDSNFESEPEDLSVRSGTSKLSSPTQTPSRDIMSDSSTLSDNEH